MSTETTNAQTPATQAPAVVSQETVDATVTTTVTPKKTAAVADATTEPVVEPVVENKEPEISELDHMAILKPLLDVLSSGSDADDTLVAKIATDLGTQPEIVELLGQGFVAMQQKRVGACFSAAGGQDSYNEIIGWAATGLSQEQSQAFNDVLNKGTVADIQQAVVALKAKFTEVNGSPKKEAKAAIGGNGGPSSAPASSSGNGGGPLKAFASDSELSEAMRDKRYIKDPVFTQEVYARAFLMGKQK